MFFFQTANQIQHDSGNQSSHSETGSYLIYFPSFNTSYFSYFPLPGDHGPHLSHPFVLLFRLAAPRVCDSQSPGIPQQVGSNFTDVCRCSLVKMLSNNAHTIILQGTAGSRSWLHLWTVPFKISRSKILNPGEVTYSFVSSWGSIFLLLNGCVKLLSRGEVTGIHLRKYRNHESKVSKQQIKHQTHCKTPVSMFLPQALPGIMGIKLALICEVRICGQVLPLQLGSCRQSQGTQKVWRVLMVAVMPPNPAGDRALHSAKHTRRSTWWRAAPSPWHHAGPGSCLLSKDNLDIGAQGEQEIQPGHTGN